MILTNIALVALAATANNPLLPSGAKVLYTVQENIVEISGEEFFSLPEEYGLQSLYRNYGDEDPEEQTFVLYEVETDTFMPRMIRHQHRYEHLDAKYTTFLFMLKHHIGIPEEPWWPGRPVYNCIGIMEYNADLGKLVSVMNQAGISDQIAAAKVEQMADFEIDHNILANSQLDMTQFHVSGALGCQYNNDFLASPAGAAIAKYSAASEFNGGVVPANAQTSTLDGGDSVVLSMNDRVLKANTNYNGVAKFSVFLAPQRINPRFMAEYTANSAVYASMNDAKYVMNYKANAIAESIGVFSNNDAPEYFMQHPNADWLDGFTPAATQYLIANSNFEVMNEQVDNDLMVARRNRMGNGAVANDLPIVARDNNN